MLDLTGDSPVTVWEQGASRGMGIYVDGNRAYLAAGYDGLCIFGLTNPDRPELLGQTKTAGSAWDEWMHDGYAYVADCDHGVMVVDVTSGEQPHPVGFVTWDAASPLAEIVRGEGDAVYVAADNHGLVAIDVSDPTDPTLASIHALAPHSWAEGLAVRDGLVYLAVGNKRNREENGLHILDVHDPYAISTLGKLRFPDWVEGVHIAGDTVYVANTWSGARAVDIREPDRPLLVDSFTLRRWIARHLQAVLRLGQSLLAPVHSRSYGTEQDSLLPVLGHLGGSRVLDRICRMAVERQARRRVQKGGVYESEQRCTGVRSVGENPTFSAGPRHPSYSRGIRVGEELGTG